MHKLNDHRRCSKYLFGCSAQGCKLGNKEAVRLFKDTNIQEIYSSSIVPKKIKYDNKRSAFLRGTP